MNTKIFKSSLYNLLDEIENLRDMRPVYNLEVGAHYQYLSSGDLFSKNFIFKVIKDNFDCYDILIERHIPYSLEKDFNLVDTINQGNIFKVTPKLK